MNTAVDHVNVLDILLHTRSRCVSERILNGFFGDPHQIRWVHTIKIAPEGFQLPETRRELLVADNPLEDNVPCSINC